MIPPVIIDGLSMPFYTSYRLISSEHVYLDVYVSAEPILVGTLRPVSNNLSLLPVFLDLPYLSVATPSYEFPPPVRKVCYREVWQI
jgi:hypothetical protein